MHGTSTVHLRTRQPNGASGPGDDGRGGGSEIRTPPLTAAQASPHTGMAAAPARRKWLQRLWSLLACGGVILAFTAVLGAIEITRICTMTRNVCW
jgi:hypothetical protein